MYVILKYDNSKFPEVIKGIHPEALPLKLQHKLNESRAALENAGNKILELENKIVELEELLDHALKL